MTEPTAQERYQSKLKAKGVRTVSVRLGSDHRAQLDALTSIHGSRQAAIAAAITAAYMRRRA